MRGVLLGGISTAGDVWRVDYAAIVLLTDKVLGVVGLSVPGLSPRDSTLLQQFHNTLIDDIVDITQDYILLCGLCIKKRRNTFDR